MAALGGDLGALGGLGGACGGSEATDWGVSRGRNFGGLLVSSNAAPSAAHPITAPPHSIPQVSSAATSSSQLLTPVVLLQGGSALKACLSSAIWPAGKNACPFLLHLTHPASPFFFHQSLPLPVGQALTALRTSWPTLERPQSPLPPSRLLLIKAKRHNPGQSRPYYWGAFTSLLISTRHRVHSWSGHSVITTLSLRCHDQVFRKTLSPTTLSTKESAGRNYSPHCTIPPSSTTARTTSITSNLLFLPPNRIQALITLFPSAHCRQYCIETIVQGISIHQAHSATPTKQRRRLIVRSHQNLPRHRQPWLRRPLTRSRTRMLSSTLSTCL